MNSKRKKKQRTVGTALRATPTQGALSFLAPGTLNDGRGDDAITLESDLAMLFGPITLTVLDPEGNEPGVASGICYISTHISDNSSNDSAVKGPGVTSPAPVATHSDPHGSSGVGHG